jgi:hypothetical protein
MSRRDHAGAMPRRGRAARHGRAAFILFSFMAVAGTAALATGSVALAADAPIKLAVEPVDEKAAFFERSLDPGESAQLVVDLSNYGVATVRARTFAADVYPIINGGFGARLRGEPATGTTTWLDYPTETIEIGPGQAIRRAFMITVPAGAEPGEYITSIVIENEEPLASGEGVAFNQFVRSAVAIVVVVPGDADAELRLGDARHSFLDGRSVVAVAIDNVGDLLVRPGGTFSLTTNSGATVDSRQVAMDAVYAHSSTWLELVLDRQLAPGRYFANIEVTDPDRGGPAAGARPFDVGEDPLPPAGNPATLATDTVNLPVVGTIDGGTSVILAFGGGVLVCAIAIGILARTRRRRRGTRPGG